MSLERRGGGRVEKRIGREQRVLKGIEVVKGRQSGVN